MTVSLNPPNKKLRSPIDAKSDQRRMKRRTRGCLIVDRDLEILRETLHKSQLSSFSRSESIPGFPSLFLRQADTVFVKLF